MYFAKQFLLIKIVLKIQMKKIVGAVCELSALQHSKSNPTWVEIGWQLPNFPPNLFHIFDTIFIILTNIYPRQHFCPHIYDKLFQLYVVSCVIATPQPNLLALLPLVVGIQCVKGQGINRHFKHLHSNYVSAVNDQACVVIMVQFLCNQSFLQDF